MKYETRITEDMIREYEGKGHWVNKTICDYLDIAVSRYPDKEVIVDPHRRITYGELSSMVDRLALAFLELGVQPGEIVSFQLPNWYQFVVIHFALTRIGAVSNPLIPIYRHREIGFMLKLCESRIMIIPSQFRGFDYTEMMRELMPDLPSLRDIFVIGEDIPKGMKPFQELMETPWEKKRDPGTLNEIEIDPNDVTEIIFTSGTTGEPKGVMHTHNTLIYPLIRTIERVKFGPEDVVLMASTFAHQTGFLYGVRLPTMIGGRGVYMDVWEAEKAVELIEKEGVTFNMGATPFLSDLAYAPNISEHDISSLRLFICGGAAIPRKLVVDAKKILNCSISAGWGQTENALVTLNNLDDPDEKIYGTDGSVIEGMEVLVTDENDNQLPPGQEGELLCRGPAHFVGYYKRRQMTEDNFTRDGWFKTGDRATMDEDGFISIAGRSKDIIIRGGENIPIVEVENILHTHPKIKEVAIVAMPDKRMQEKACAYVIPQEGESLTFQEMIDFLAEHKMAKQYYPERLEVIDQFPMTPSGKVQKYVLRKMIGEKIGEGGIQN
jgi:cyclohexanecarboxylate-CoA ligase